MFSCCFYVLVLCWYGGCLLCILCFLHVPFSLIYCEQNMSFVTEFCRIWVCKNKNNGYITRFLDILNFELGVVSIFNVIISFSLLQYCLHEKHLSAPYIDLCIIIFSLICSVMTNETVWSFYIFSWYI